MINIGSVRAVRMEIEDGTKRRPCVDQRRGREEVCSERWEYKILLSILLRGSYKMFYENSSRTKK